MKRVALLLLFAVGAFGQDAATVALDPKADLGAALKSSDALTRATAARVALVRDSKDFVPQLREVLSAEQDATVAREVIRAIVLLGSDDDVAFTASQLRRFPLSIDTDFGEAVARIGAPRATNLYLKHVATSRDPAPAVRFALWGRAGLASGTASRFMAAGLDFAYRQVLKAAAEAGLILDSGVLLAGLRSSSAQVVTDTVWHLVELYAFDPSKVPESLREPATAARETSSTAEDLGRELLRRMLGAKAVERPEFAELLKSGPGRSLVPQSEQVRRYLTPGEMKAIEEGKESFPAAPKSPLAQTVREPEFRLPVVLPAGLASAILAKTKCSDSWLGVVKATVDRAGRVQSLDLRKTGTFGRCEDALRTMLQLSLAEPEKITSPLESANLVTVKPRGRAVCMDEDTPEDLLRSRGVLRVGGEVTAPKAVKRVEPHFPERVRRELKSSSFALTMEAVITSRGCVRDIRLLTQSPWPELNGSSVVALSEWTFEPARINGVPVDVLFNLTINYKLR